MKRIFKLFFNWLRSLFASPIHQDWTEVTYSKWDAGERPKWMGHKYSNVYIKGDYAPKPYPSWFGHSGRHNKKRLRLIAAGRIKRGRK